MQNALEVTANLYAELLLRQRHWHAGVLRGHPDPGIAKPRSTPRFSWSGVRQQLAGLGPRLYKSSWQVGPDRDWTLRRWATASERSGPWSSALASHNSSILTWLPTCLPLDSVSPCRPDESKLKDRRMRLHLWSSLALTERFWPVTSVGVHSHADEVSPVHVFHWWDCFGVSGQKVSRLDPSTLVLLTWIPSCNLAHRP